MFLFRKIWRGLFSCNIRFDIRPFALLLTNSETCTCHACILADAIVFKIFNHKVISLRFHLNKTKPSKFRYCDLAVVKDLDLLEIVSKIRFKY